MSIRFFTKAEDVGADGKPRLYFEVEAGEPTLANPSPKTIGHADEAIIKQHAEEYAAYLKGLEAPAEEVIAPGVVEETPVETKEE